MSVDSKPSPLSIVTGADVLVSIPVKIPLSEKPFIFLLKAIKDSYIVSIT